MWVYNVTPEINALSEYPKILAICISLTAIMLLIVSLRMYVRWVMVKAPGWDDYAIIASTCQPVHKSWRPSTVGTCLPNDSTFYALGAVSIAFDCVIFCLPIPLIFRLQMNTRRKCALAGVFLLGLFTTVCSVMRMIQITQISRGGNSTGLVLWGTVELNVGIALTCIPALAPIFTYFNNKSSVAGHSYDREAARREMKRGKSLRPFSPTTSSYAHHMKSFRTKTSTKQDSKDDDSQDTILGSASAPMTPAGVVTATSPAQVDDVEATAATTDDGPHSQIRPGEIWCTTQVNIKYSGNNGSLPRQTRQKW
ncbi:MAG: hypothetical protein M1817_002547 [Caeruleum heppii]|nr:MAG: hypothetical protein M1817_002547 [Caeruleum heppii]